MGDEKIKSFDLTAMMRRGDIDALKFATNNPQTTAEEYFILLSRFVKNAPAAEDAIHKIAEFKHNEKDVKALKDSKILLTCVGHDAILKDLSALLHAVEEDNKRLASILAQNFFDAFRGVHKRTLAAEIGSLKDFFEQHKKASHPPMTLLEALRLATKKEAVQNPRVLSVDQSPLMVKTVAAALGSEYTVEGLTDPAKLEHKLLRFMPDLFLIEVMMPKISGFDLIPAIRRHAEHKETPVIMVTGDVSKELIATAASLGVSDYIIKPIKPKILREKVAKHTAKKERRILL